MNQYIHINLKKKKELYYEIDEITNNIKTNLKNDEYKLSEKDKELLEKLMNKHKNWLLEKKYNERDEKEYKEVIEEITNKFGTLILKANKTKDVDGLGNKVKATTIYGDEKDDAEINKEDYDDKLVDDDLMLQDIDDEEKKEIKTLKNNLIELSHSIFDLLNDNDKINKNISKDESIRIVDFIDDILLWSYTANKPRKIDFINKINEINDECNKLFEKYKDTFTKKEESIDKLDELEKLCYSLQSSLACGVYTLKKEHQEMIDNKLEYYFEEISNYRLKEYENIFKEEKEQFYNKFSTYIIEINNMCEEIEKELTFNDMGIKLDNNMIVNINNEEGTDILSLLNNS